MRKYVLLFTIIFVPIAAIVLFILGFLKIVGVSYQSNFSLLKFLILLFFVEIILDNLFTVLSPVKNNIINFILLFLALNITDMVLSTVNINIITTTIIALFFTIIENLIDKNENAHSNRHDILK